MHSFFLGYDGYPNFFEGLMTCILNRITKHKEELARESVKGNGKCSCKVDQDDSGFDTSDSSDEKTRKQRLRYTVGSSSRTSTSQLTSKKQVERQH